MLSILYVAPGSGTSLHRARALASLGHRVRPVESGFPSGFWRYQIHRFGHHLRRPPDLMGTNRALFAALRERSWDLVWVDKGSTIRPEILEAVRRDAPGTRLVSYSPDDARLLYRESIRYRRAVPLYDLHVTTKSYNVPELRSWGARDVLFIDNAYCPEVHRPLVLSPADRDRFGCEVGFVGYYERDRAVKMRELARAGIPVLVQGPAWSRFLNRHPGLTVREEFLGDEDYAKAVNATGINLGFLRKRARDLQTTRSVEIPACGGFLLAERTSEHRALFEEGREAEFFEDFEELLEKCRYYRAHPEERARIAAAGLERCRRAGYSNAARLARVLDHLMQGDCFRRDCAASRSKL